MIFTTEQLDAMKAAQHSHMNDVVNITNITYTTDQYGDVVSSGVTQSGVSCGFNFTEGIEIDKGQIIIVNYDAEVRLPLDIMIDINDTVTLVTLAGEAHNEVFEVFQYPKYGTTAKLIALKRRNS